MKTLPLKILPSLALCADIATAVDAQNGLVVSERDYISRWLCTLQNNWRMLGGNADYLGATNTKNIEEGTGSDCFLAMVTATEFKIVLIEAKRTYRGFDGKKDPSAAAQELWEEKTPSSISRFSDEIARQRAIIKKSRRRIGVFEAFFSLPKDKTIARQHMLLASHVCAYKVIDPWEKESLQPSNKWTVNDQKRVLGSNNENAQTIEQVLTGMINCKISKPYLLSAKNLNGGTTLDKVKSIITKAIESTEKKDGPANGKRVTNQPPLDSPQIAVFEGSGKFGSGKR